MFHMPLFFFMSGLCFKEKYLSDFKSFFKRRVQGIYVPFVKWSLIFLFLHNIFFHLNLYNGIYGFRDTVSELYSPYEFVKKTYHIIFKMVDNEQLLGGYWFLRTLFWCSLGTYIYIRLFDKYLNKIVGCAVLLSLTIVFSYLKCSVPYFLIGSTESLAASFFYTGYVYRRNSIEHHEVEFILVGFLFVTLGFVYSRASMLNFTCSQVIPYYSCAILGTLMVYKMSILVNRLDASNWLKCGLVYIGENTLTILTWHFLSFKLVNLLIILIYGLPIQHLAEFPTIVEYSSSGWFFIYFIVGVVVPISFTKIRVFNFNQ